MQHRQPVLVVEFFVRKIFPVVAAGATALALAGGTFGYVTLQKDVTLSVDGQVQEFTTAARTVGDLLASRDITTTDRDVVVPAPDTALSDGTRVAVQFGRPVQFVVDGAAQTVWTTATRVDTAIQALSVDTAGAELSTSRSAPIGRQGLTVDVATEKTVTLDAAGKRRTLTTTAATVGDALSEAKIRVDSDDKVKPAAAAKLRDGAKVRYTRVDVATVKARKAIAYKVVRTTSKKVTKGVTKISKSGSAGTRQITFRVVKENGREVSRKQTASKVLRAPTARVVVVGTRVVTRSSSSSSSSASGGVWDKIAKCESGGNWSINTGNGYYGGLQFSASTWRAYGGSGMAHQASKAQQIAIATKVQKAQGWGAWPACTAKLGLR